MFREAWQKSPAELHRGQYLGEHHDSRDGFHSHKSENLILSLHPKVTRLSGPGSHCVTRVPLYLFTPSALCRWAQCLFYTLPDQNADISHGGHCFPGVKACEAQGS